MEQDFTLYALFCDLNGIVVDMEQDFMLQKTLYFWYTDSYTDSKFYGTEQDAMIAAITFLDMWIDYDLFVENYKSQEEYDNPYDEDGEDLVSIVEDSGFPDPEEYYRED